MEIQWTNIASTIGGIIALIYIVAQTIPSWLERFGWFKEQHKKREAEKTEQIAKVVSQAIDKTLPPYIEELKRENEEQNNTLKILKHGLRDTMRFEFNKVYNKYYRYKKIPKDERDALEYLFSSYTASDGNSYVIDRWEEIKKWDVVTTYDEALKKT